MAEMILHSYAEIERCLFFLKVYNIYIIYMYIYIIYTSDEVSLFRNRLDDSSMRLFVSKTNGVNCRGQDFRARHRVTESPQRFRFQKRSGFGKVFFQTLRASSKACLSWQHPNVEAEKVSKIDLEDVFFVFLCCIQLYSFSRFYFIRCCFFNIFIYIYIYDKVYDIYVCMIYLCI